jgi:hypothetical protein
MDSKSTIVIIVLVFALFGLLLGFAESSSNNTMEKFSQYRTDPESLEINSTDSDFAAPSPP